MNAPATITFSELIECLSGIGLSLEKVEEVAADPTIAGDPQKLIDRLLERGLITQHQLSSLRSGKTSSLAFGDYIILRPLGAGGMAKVFMVRHRATGQYFALKLLPTASMGSEVAIRRFDREAKVLAQLSHPNVVAFQESGVKDGVHFLVMEYMSGGDLYSRVKDHGALSVYQTIGATLMAARGLQHIHEKGIIHRDIKPENLLIDPNGVVKVLDLGLARASEEEGADEARLTQPRDTLGTFDYMSPEQAVNSGGVDHRADIYGLGCVLHFLVCGQPVFKDCNFAQKLIAHQCYPVPSLRDSNPDVPESFDAVFQKMLQKSPDDRYADMGELIAAIEGLGIEARNILERSSQPVKVAPSQETTVELARSDTHPIERKEVAAAKQPAPPPQPQQPPVAPPKPVAPPRVQAESILQTQEPVAAKPQRVLQSPEALMQSHRSQTVSDEQSKGTVWWIILAIVAIVGAAGTFLMKLLAD